MTPKKLVNPNARAFLARKISCAWLAVGLALVGPGATAQTATQFSDGFDVPGNMLDTSKWTTEFGGPADLGRTHVRDWVTNSAANPFVVADGAAQLALDTFNQGSSLVSGTHGKTLASFQPTATTDYILKARVRLTSLQPGLVFGIYLYACYPGCQTRHDELDIEILTNFLQPGSSPRVQLNRYAAEPLGAGHGPIVDLPAGFDPLSYHEWAIRWAIDRVTYFVDGQELFAATTSIPQGPMQANVIVWAPSSDWVDAYHASLQPVTSGSQNQRFMALVDSVSVSSASRIRAPASSTRLVTNTSDSGPGSLRQTVADAVVGDTIAFSPGLTGVISLTSEIAIAKDLTISGPGFNLLTISGNHANRIFTTAGGRVTIGGLTFSSGVAPDFGGAISNSGVLALNECVFTDNFAGSLGDGRGQGGAVWSTGALTVVKSVFSANRSTGNGGGIRSSGTLVVERSTFNGNSANYFGGGIYTLGSGTIADSILTVNQAATGGGIWNEDDLLRIASSTLSGNSATFGGGLASKFGTVTALNTTFSGNTAASGGGIDLAGAVHLINSTIFGNRATSSNGRGGGANASGTLNLLNSIVAVNTVPSVSGLGPDIAGTVVSLGHNLIGDASGLVGLVHGVHGDLAGSSMSVLDPRLGPLADNGGLTKTHALQPGSPAIDAGDSLVLGSPYALASDQRGASRAVGVAPDMGSFESAATPPVVSIITRQPSSQTIASGQTATLCVTTGGVSPHGYQWYLGSGGPAGQLVAGATSACFTTPPLTVSTDFFVRVSNGIVAADSTTATVVVRPTRLLVDADGDGKTELTIFRPVNGTWYVRYSSLGYGGGFDAFQWGLQGDLPIAADFDGDGKVELTIFRPANGTWYIRYSSLGYSIASAGVFQWGLPGDVPIPADFDGDGKTELTVWRPSNGTWYIRYSSFGFNIANAGAFQWGLPGDVPSAADFDGDGKTELTVWRPSNGTWYVRYSSLGYGGGFDAFQWGLPGDLPIAADFDGDGKVELTIFRPANGTWYIRYSSLGYNIGSAGVFQWGLPGDVPITADFDGDGKTELTVWRPSNGTWYIRYSSLGFSSANAGAFQWGLPGDANVK